LGKFAHGVADDFLSTLYLSTTTPVVIAPAMNVEMWHHPATQKNVQILQGRGVVIVEPGVGYQACGEEGEGRLAEPEEIVQVVLKTLKPTKNLMGKKVLVTAGPTIEDIDPVRYISNRSGGKMGYAIADEAQQRGASVTLVSGPTHLEPLKKVVVVSVRSCSEMAQAVFDHFSQVDVLVMAAAVSDFTPARMASQKIKKEGRAQSIQLEPTIDILKELRERRNGQLLVGFAADSENIRENARKKIQEKGLDLIVANDISGTEQGFQVDMNQVILIDSEGNEEEYPILPKTRVAKLLWNRIEKALHGFPRAASTRA
jgi:phosphopantothenoylcysteine decarboxylase/phosphopantothenate--cysteine ligase